MRDRASALLVLQCPLSLSLPPQVLWPAQTRGTGRGMLQQWMLLFRKIITRENCFLLVAAAVTSVLGSTSTRRERISLFLVIQCRTSTLAATFPFVCVLPVEGLVVFSTVGHSVTAGAGFAPGTTTHPAKLQSGDGQRTVVRFRLTGWFILWRKIRTHRETILTPAIMLWKEMINYTWTDILGKRTNLVEGRMSRSHSSLVADFWKLRQDESGK